MAQQVEFTLDAKEAGAVRAWLAVQRAADQFNASVLKIDDSQQQAQKSAAEWGAKAKRVLAELESPQERHNRKLAEYSELRKRNLISEQLFAAAVRRSREELDSATQKSNGFFDGAAGKVASLAAGYFTVTTAVNGIKFAIDAVMESNRKFIEQAEEAGAKYDKLFRQFRIQAGLGAIEGDAAKTNILKQAEIAGFTEDRAASAATALVSAGVSPEQASGGALAGFLATLNAQGLRDADPSQYADALTAVLQSNGMQVDAANMTKLGVQLQSEPIKATKLKLTSLPKLASISSGLAGAMTQEEQLAAYAVGGSAAGNFDSFGTSMADIIKNLRIAGSKTDATEYLGKIGLKPGDVDFVGEDFRTVMQRFGGALDKAPEELRSQVLAKVIEGGNISNFNLMRNNLGTILDTAGSMNSAESQRLYANDVMVGSSGIDAARTRQALRRNRIQAERDTQGSLLRNELIQRSLERGDSPLAQDLQGRYFDSIRFLGFDDQSALSAGSYLGAGLREFGVSGGRREALPPGIESGVLGRMAYDAGFDIRGANSGVAERLGSSLEAQNRMMAEQNRLLAEQNQLMKGGADKPNVTPPAPVASSLNDSRLKTGRP